MYKDKSYIPVYCILLSVYGRLAGATRNMDGFSLVIYEYFFLQWVNFLFFLS